GRGGWHRRDHGRAYCRREGDRRGGLGREPAAAGARARATHAVHGRDPDLVAKIMATTGGRGMDYSLDATGTDKTVGLAMQVLASRGTCGFVDGPPPSAERPIHRTRHESGPQLVDPWGVHRG